MDVADETDNLDAIRVAEGDALSNCVLPREVLLRERLVDDEHQRCARAVLWRQIASRDQRDSHGVEESIAREHERRGRLLTVRPRGNAGRKDSDVLAVATEWEISNTPGRYDARKRPNLVEHGAVHLTHG